MPEMPRSGARARRGTALALAIAASVSFLPFLRGVAAGHVLYFRDLSVLFHPFRQYVIEGLRAGELRYWDPYVHEGVPLLYPPLGYPIDLLQVLWPGPWAVSVLLALHVPLAAAGFVLLARGLGLSPLAAAGGALAYALGGFVLSTVNLYVYVEAAAWAPFVVLGLRAAGRGRARAVGPAALAVAMALASLGVEIALQAVVIGLVLAVRVRRPAALLRPLAAVVLGAAVAAPVVLVMRANMAAGERAHGFTVDVALNQSVHPFTLVQVVVADLYGDLERLPDRWWGSNFFDRGFPYVVSLYLGTAVLALALSSALSDRRRSARLVVVAAAALLVALGRWGGLGRALAAMPDSWRIFRYPTKAFFSVHLCLALLAAIGLHALARGRAWRVFLAAALVLGLPLALAGAAPLVLPAPTRWFVAHFFPPAITVPFRMQDLSLILADATRGGLLALAGALVAGLVLRGRIRTTLGAALVAAVAVTDLLRAGAGLNPMVAPAFLRTSATLQAALGGLAGLQRVFTCHPERSRAYWQARALRPQDHEALTFAAWADTLTPHLNRPLHVRSALGEDLTSLVPRDRLLPAGVGCSDAGGLVPWLRGAGVSHVLSLDPIQGTGLRPLLEVAPARLAPLRVHIYAVDHPLPLRFVASAVRRGRAPRDAADGDRVAVIAEAPEEVDGATGTVRVIGESPEHLAFEVTASRPTAFVVLDGWSPGWRATVDGRPAPVLAAGPHRAVWVGAGTSRVEMAYRPPALRAGLGLCALGLVGVALVWTRRARRRPRAAAQPAGGSSGP